MRILMQPSAFSMLHIKLMDVSIRTALRCFIIPRKTYSSKKHRALQAEQNSSTAKALSQLDDFYSSVFQDEWPSIRVALLSEEKRGALINNFSDKELTKENLRNLGAYNVREIWENQKRVLSANSNDHNTQETSAIYQIDGRIEEALLRQQKIDLEEIFPEPLDSIVTHTRNLSQHPSSENHKEDFDEERANKPFDLSKDQPLAETLKSADYDTSRIIAPGHKGLALTASLYDFMPATRLKGMDDYIPESAHYAYYKDSPETPVKFKVESEIEFPKLLDVYAYERGNCDTFDESRKGSTNVFDYHIMKLGSLAPVVALNLQEGDRVLDLTTVSLDIPLLIIQSLVCDMFVVNCGDQSRGKYLLRFLDSYMYNIREDNSNVVVTDYHALEMQDMGKFDKILVSVPNTRDRKAVTENENNMFSHTFVKTRIKLPEMQSEYLKKALELVKEGGAVLYFTETLSPIQNDAVVQRVLDDLWLNSNLDFTVMDLSQALRPLEPFMKIIKTSKFGQLVIPFLPNNCGPIYFSKIVKNPQNLDRNKNSL